MRRNALKDSLVMLIPYKDYIVDEKRFNEVARVWFLST